jgi:hypothetical protein
MSLTIKPHNGDREVAIDTAYLLLRQTVHADGTVTVHEVEIRDPRAPSIEHLRIAEAKAKVCDACEHSQGVVRDRGGEPVYGVKCKQCGCGLFRLLAKRCPIGKHDELTGDLTQ